MDSYNPDLPVNPKAWLETDEGERIAMAKHFHKKEGIKVPNCEIHATMHTIVENQLAEGKPRAIRATLKRLISEGLTRHDAIHAIGCVLSEHMHNLLTGVTAEFSDKDYQADLAKLTPKSWVEKYGPQE